MSPLAAGVGLNVVGANHVIHYTRHWNPAKEEKQIEHTGLVKQKMCMYIIQWQFFQKQLITQKS